MRPDTVTLAILGGGAAATALLAALTHRDAVPGRIVVVDPASDLPGGAAYRRAEPHHLLNARAAIMSVDARRPEEFARFAARAGATPATFAPRRLYAAYLAQRFVADVAKLKARGVEVTHARARALGLDSDGGRFQVRLSDGGALHADHVTLALGPAPKRPLGPAHDRIVRDPWSASLRSLAARGGAQALIVGAGLTAIDVATSLARAGWAGTILMASRGGVLPKAHLSDGFVARCADHAGALLLRPLAEALWRAAAPEWRGHALRRGLSPWNARRYRMAPGVAAEVRALAQSGLVRLVTRGVAALAPDEEGVRVDWGDGGQSRAAFVVDARGFDAGLSAFPLAADLVKRGLARPSQTGFGLAPDSRLQVGGAGGGAIYALGAVLMGERLETTSIPALRRQAATVAAALAERLRPCSRGLRAA